MEWVDIIKELVASFGFPIAACVFMARYVVSQNKQHQEEVSKMTDAINELKIAITTLIEKLR